MTTSKQFIASALRQRLQDVRERMSALGLNHEMACAQLEVPASWKTSSNGCLASFRLLITGEALSTCDVEPEPSEVALEALRSVARDSARRYDLLTQRYSYPLNFLAQTEENIREHLLERLMVQDRAVIERSSVESINKSELLVRLNLLSLYAAVSSDLRYLDALNYYFELLPEDLNFDGEQRELYVTFLSLYERALQLSI